MKQNVTLFKVCRKYNFVTVRDLVKESKEYKMKICEIKLRVCRMYAVNTKFLYYNGIITEVCEV